MRSVVRRLGRGLVPGLFLLGVAAPALAAPSRAWLGVMTQTVTEELRDALDLKVDGVLVNRVVNGGPADRAGIKKGDIITGINSGTVESPGELADAVQALAAGANASIKLLRHGAAQTILVKLEVRPASMDDEDSWTAPTPQADHGDRHEIRIQATPDGDHEHRGDVRVRAFKDGKQVDPEDLDLRGLEGLPGLDHLDGLGALPRMMMLDGGRPRLGVRLQKLNPDLAGYFGGTNGRGALVVEVIEDTPAEKAGLKAGDVITAVGSTNVDDTDDLIKAIADDEGKVSLTVVRKGVRRTIEADLGDAPRNSMTWRMRDGRAPRAPATPHARGMMRIAPDRGGSDTDLHRELQELRDELREMKKQLEDRNR